MEQQKNYSEDKLRVKSNDYSVQQLGTLVSSCKETTKLSTPSFLKKTFELDKIKEVSNFKEFNPAFSLMMTEIIALSAIKSEIQQIDIDDITKMILTHYGALSLNEIYKSFDLERYGLYDVKTPAYDRFNADYVSTILIKYKKWKQQGMIAHNISSQKPVEIPYDDRTEAFKYFQVLKETNTLERCVNIGCVYQFLYDKMVLPKHLRAFKEEMLNDAKITEVIIVKRDRGRMTDEELQVLIDEIKTNDAREETRRTVKRLIVTNYFRDLICRNIELETEI